jgi:eukaryotic-like serine/threonine-protein kinase
MTRTSLVLGTAATVAVLIVLSFVVAGYGTVLGQTATNNNFTTFENPKFGLKIQYPANWAKEITDDPDLGQDVTFLVPGSQIKYGEKVSIMVNANQTGPLNEIVRNLISFNQNENNALGNYKVIESVPTTLNGLNAHKLVTTYTDPKFKIINSMQVMALKGDKLYEILYTSNPAKYQTLLPIVQQMIDSFQFIG